MLSRLLYLSRENPKVLITGASIVTAILSFVLLTYPKASYITLMLQDNFIFMDGAYRLLKGQLPYIDFHTPAGPLYYLIPFFGFKLSGTYGGAMPMGMGLTTLASSLLIAYVVSTRFHRYWLGASIAIYLVLLIAGPSVLGWNPFGVTMAMWYNRLGWVLICLLFLLFMPASIDQARAKWLDAMVISIVLVCCFYLKMTYFAAAITFAILLFLIQKDQRFSVIAGLATFVAVICCVELVWGIHRSYLGDLSQAIKVSGALRHGSANGMVLSALKPMLLPVVRSLPEVAMVLMALLPLLLFRCLTWRDGLFILFVMGASAAIFNQNAQPAHWPPIVVLLGFSVQRLVAMSAQVKSREAWVYFYAPVALLAAYLVQPFYSQLTALSQQFLNARKVSHDVGIPEAIGRFKVDDPDLRYLLDQEPKLKRLEEDGAYDRLRVYVNPLQRIYQSEYFRTVVDGANTLRGLATKDDHILVLDFVNPFSFILDTPPPRGDASFLHKGRSFDRTTYIAPEKLFGSVELVAVPKRPVAPASHDLLVELYGAYVAQHYDRTKESTYWSIWSKRRPVQ